MAKEVDTFIKLQVRGGQANPCSSRWSGIGCQRESILWSFASASMRRRKTSQGQCPARCDHRVFKDKSFSVYVIKTHACCCSTDAEAAKIKEGISGIQPK